MKIVQLFCLILILCCTQVFSQANNNPDPVHINVEANGNRIVLKPVGFQDSLDVNGYSQDSKNILWAAQTVKTGGEVQFKKGTFHVSRTLVFTGFQGSFSGAGTNKTVIAARGALVNGQYSFPLLSEQERQKILLPGFPYVFVFQNAPYQDNWQQVSTKLQMSELSVTVVGRGPAGNYFGTPIYNLKGAILMVGSQAVYNVSAEHRVEHLEGKFENINIYGQGEDLDIGTNLGEGILVFGGEIWIEQAQPSDSGWNEGGHLPINAVIEITNSYFHNTWLQAAGVETPMSYPIVNSPILTSGLTFPPLTFGVYPPASVTITNNVFNNVGRGTVNETSAIFVSFILSPSGTTSKIVDNKYYNIFNHAVAIVAGQALTETNFPQDPSQTFVQYNYISMIKASPGSINSQSILVADFNMLTATPSLTTFVQFNTLIAGDGYSSNLIEHLIGAGTIIVDNIFKGTNRYAVVLGNQAFPNGIGGFFYLPVVADLVQGNDFTQFQANTSDIILGPGSAQCTVIQPGATVINQGTANIVVV